MVRIASQVRQALPLLDTQWNWDVRLLTSGWSCDAVNSVAAPKATTALFFSLERAAPTDSEERSFESASEVR